jgi:hypothetical protein
MSGGYSPELLSQESQTDQDTRRTSRELGEWTCGNGQLNHSSNAMRGDGRRGPTRRELFPSRAAPPIDATHVGSPPVWSIGWRFGVRLSVLLSPPPPPGRYATLLSEW